MPTPRTHAAEHDILIAAPLDVVREIMLDVERWPQVHARAVHAEFIERGGDSELIQHWSVVDDHTVRSWRARRRVVGERRIEFEHEPAAPPFATMRGGWTLEQSGDTTHVRMFHEFVLLQEDEDVAAARLASVADGSRQYLGTLKSAAENRAELARLTISFTDPLFIAGEIEDVYDYLYDARKWPERIPHVTRLVLEENSPGVQFFDMDTVSADGSRHTTRSVRICMPFGKIVYKQTRPPKTLDAHTGHWEFVRTPEGMIASARHTATIRPDGLHLLGEGMTVDGARKYLRRVLSANSMGNLVLAKAFAEESAGFGSKPLTGQRA